MLIAIEMFALLVSIVLVIYYLGMKKNIFFAADPEGKVMVMMRGKTARFFFGNIHGCLIEPETGEVFEISQLTDVAKKTALEAKIESCQSYLGSEFHKYTKLRLVGLWPIDYIHTYEFRWNEWRQKPENSKFEMIPRSEMVNSIFYRFPYAITIDECETKQKVPLTIIVVITVLLVNARKALFHSGKMWLETLTAGVQSTVRDYVGNLGLDEITDLQHESGRSGFIKVILELNEDSFTPAIPATADKPATPALPGNPSLPKRIGVMIEAANFISYEITGKDALELIKATTLKAVAIEQGKAAMRKDKLVAKGITAIGAANAGALDLEIIARKKLDGLQSVGMGIEKTKATNVTVILDSKSVVPTIPIKP